MLVPDLDLNIVKFTNISISSFANDTTLVVKTLICSSGQHF